MAAIDLVWGKPSTRVVKGMVGLKHRSKKKYAYIRDTHNSVGLVQSNGLRQIEGQFWCDRNHGCDAYKRSPLFRSFAAARWWVQWRWEECCAKQVEHVLLKASDDADEVG